MAEMYRSAFTQTDLMSTVNPVATAGTFVKLGEYKVQAGEQIAVGFGEQSGQDNAQGRVFMKIRDNVATPGKVPGKVRLSVHSPQNRPLIVLGEWRTETLESGETDRALQIPLPVSNVFVSEDKKIVLEFMADTTATLDRADCVILMDTTVEAL